MIATIAASGVPGRGRTACVWDVIASAGSLSTIHCGFETPEDVRKRAPTCASAAAATGPPNSSDGTRMNFASAYSRRTSPTRPAEVLGKK